MKSSQRMELSPRQVSVSDLPPEITEDDLALLFESQTFCPDGGDVECVEVDEDTRTAVVTLEDERGTWHRPLLQIRPVIYRVDQKWTVLQVGNICKRWRKKMFHIDVELIFFAKLQKHINTLN